MSKSDTKQAAIAVYEILKQYSSWEHVLNQNEIRKLLEEEYRIVLSRNTLSDTLRKLAEFYEETDGRIGCTISARSGAKGEDGDYRYGWYFDHNAAKDMLSDEEILILIDTCLYARNLEVKETKELIKKLRRMASLPQKQRMDYLGDIPEKQFNINKMTTKYINLLRGVCSENKGKKQKWVSFFFNFYNAKKELETDGKRHTVLPLAVCEADHRYYLICVAEWNHEALRHYRIDLMTKLKTEEEHAPIDGVPQLREKLHNMSEYMSTHLYMFYDEPVRMELEIPKQNGAFNATFLVDAFGRSDTWSVIRETDETAVVRVVCSPEAMWHFLMQYADKRIRVIKPEKFGKKSEKK